MNKLIDLLKSSGAFVIYIWLATILVGVVSLSIVPRLMTLDTKSDLQIFRSLDFVIWLFKGLPMIAFIVILIKAILITIDWIKSKFKKMRFRREL